MYTISKKFNFSASHQLQGLPDTHPCTRLHGHNYQVEVILQSETLSEIGFVVDYRDLDLIKKWIDEHLDHRHLNEFLVFNPTAELIAKCLYGIFKEYFPALYAIRVSETEKTWAEYHE